MSRGQHICAALQVMAGGRERLGAFPFLQEAVPSGGLDGSGLACAAYNTGFNSLPIGFEEGPGDKSNNNDMIITDARADVFPLPALAGPSTVTAARDLTAEQTPPVKGVHPARIDVTATAEASSSSDMADAIEFRAEPLCFSDNFEGGQLADSLWDWSCSVCPSGDNSAEDCYYSFPYETGSDTGGLRITHAGDTGPLGYSASFFSDDTSLPTM